MPSLTRQEEVQRIVAVFGPQGQAAMMSLLERQFTVLHHRAQVLLALCGAVISVTGFSGRAIAGTSLTSQVLVVAGLGLVLLAGAMVVGGVLPLRWLTQHRPQTTGADDWLLTALEYRDRKTRCYRVSIILLLAGLTLYVIALAMMLLSPATLR